MARGWLNWICHHQFVASRPPFQALPASAENRSPLMAPSAVKPPKTVDAETTGEGGVIASAQARVPQAANRMNHTPIRAEIRFVMLYVWSSVAEGSLPSERNFRARFNGGAAVFARTLALRWECGRLARSLWPKSKGVCNRGVTPGSGRLLPCASHSAGRRMDATGT